MGDPCTHFNRNGMHKKALVPHAELVWWISRTNSALNSLSEAEPPLYNRGEAIWLLESCLSWDSEHEAQGPWGALHGRPANGNVFLNLLETSQNTNRGLK